jgi:integrase
MAGSMRQLGPDRWELRVFVDRDPVTRKQRTRSMRFDGNRRAAARQLALFVADVMRSDADTNTKPQHLKLSGLVDVYLERWAGSPTTLGTYRSILRVHIEPTIGQRDLSKVNTKLLDDFYAYLTTTKKLAPSTVRQVHAVLRGALGQAVRWGWLTSNPARDATLPARRKPDLQLPTKDQVARVLAAVEGDDPEFAMFLRLSVTTGARRGELCGLRWSDVDFDRGTLRIERSIAEVTGEGGLVKDTKNHSKRRIALDPDTLDDLRAHRQFCDERAVEWAVATSSDPWMFSAYPDSSAPWYPGSASHLWTKACARAGVEGIRLHDLRHFQATMLLRAGIPVKNVSARIGHRDAATTLNVYAHFLEDVDVDSAAVAASLVSPSPRQRQADASS